MDLEDQPPRSDGQLTLTRLPKKTRRHVRSKTVAVQRSSRLLGSIERALGSRAELSDMIEASAPDERFVKLLGYLKDTDFRMHGVLTLLGFCKIPIADFLRVIREALMVPAQLHAQAIIAKNVGEVVQQTLNDAKEVWVECPTCEGAGKFSSPRGRPKRCVDCSGLGKVHLAVNQDNRKLALELAGFTGREKKGVTVNVNQAFGLPAFEDRLALSVPVRAERVEK